MGVLSDNERAPQNGTRERERERGRDRERERERERAREASERVCADSTVHPSYVYAKTYIYNYAVEIAIS